MEYTLYFLDAETWALRMSVGLIRLGYASKWANLDIFWSLESRACKEKDYRHMNPMHTCNSILVNIFSGAGQVVRGVREFVPSSRRNSISKLADHSVKLSELIFAFEGF